jgi:hypothetical protein
VRRASEPASSTRTQRALWLRESRSVRDSSLRRIHGAGYGRLVPARVRDFVYLDHTLVAQTLSQLDFGVFKEWEETLERASGKEGRAGLTLWGAANIGGGATRSQTEGSTVVLQQTAESYAARLLLRLEEEDQVTTLDAQSGPELRRGSIVVADGTAAEFKVEQFEFEGWPPTAMVQLYSLNEELEDLERPGTFTPEHVKAASVIRTGSLSVVAPLLSGHLRVPIHEILDEAVEVLASVRRVHSHGTETLLIARPIAIY